MDSYWTYLKYMKRKATMTKITREEEQHEDSYWRFMKAVKKLCKRELKKIKVTKLEESFPNEERSEKFKHELIREFSKKNMLITAWSSSRPHPYYIDSPDCHVEVTSKNGVEYTMIIKYIIRP